jgi:glutamine amidotransferase
MKDVIVCDYGVGNLFNVYRALEFLHFDFAIDTDGSRLKHGKKILIPGVAAFGEGISNLHKSGQFASLLERDASGIGIVGLCLGAQMMLSSSEEAIGTAGLGVISGTVKHLNPRSVQSPHQGWAEVEITKTGNERSVGQQLQGHFFFSHGYYMSPADSSQIIATVRVGELEVPSVIASENRLGIQFHPERSGNNGLRFLKMALT